MSSLNTVEDLLPGEISDTEVARMGVLSERIPIEPWCVLLGGL